MSNALYLRPLGLLYGAAAQEATAAGRAAVLAGGRVAFSLLEVIEGRPGSARREVRSLPELKSSSDEAIASLLERLTHARAPVAGLTMDRPQIMGVVNVTPDSFSGDGIDDDTGAAIAHAHELAAAGADILDVGGESTRPGSDAVDADRELARIVPVIEGLRDAPARISVDTRKAAVMRAVVEKGAHILNDVSALTVDPASVKTAATSGLPVVLMHAQGDPKTMQDDPRYDDVLLEVCDYLEARVAACEAAGIPRERLIVDPGIGFGKTLEHNLALLSGLSLFHGLGVPVLLGASRKRFIGALAEEPDAQKRMPGSLAAALAGAAQGVQILRVHDVRATRQALSVWTAAISGSPD